MRKNQRRFIIAVITALIILIPIGRAEAGDSYYYSVIPPASTVTINGDAVANASTTQGKMLFESGQQQEIIVPNDVAGFRIFSNAFHLDVNRDAVIDINGKINLKAGSIHVVSTSSSAADMTISVGDLSLSFQSADFLVFASGDQSEKILKVLTGEVTIENPTTEQKAIVKAKESTSSDQSGKLLIPFPFVPNPSSWWDDAKYKAPYASLPIADAGDDQRVIGNMPVMLDGSRSSFRTGDIFEWILAQGPSDDKGQQIKEVAFDSVNIVKPLFTPVVDGEYHFTLQITDENGERSNTAAVVVFVGKRYLEPLAIFPDVPLDHPDNLAITYLYKKNVMKGSVDQKSGKILFRPDDTINRVEILKTIFENQRQKIPSADELKTATADDLFLDVKAEHWFAPYVYLAKKMSIIKGNNGLYRPADKVLLVEALKMIVTANQISLDSFQDVKEPPYPDAEAQAWYSPYLLFVKKYNLVDPDAAGNIHPGEPLTRARFAEIIYRMDSINLTEKRAFLSGTLKDAKTKKVIPQGEIYVYKVLNDPSSSGGSDGVAQKGDLYFKTTTKKDGSFSISLPVGTKYSIEAINGNDVSTHRAVIELEEAKNQQIELEIDSAN